jgi:hypothetical protein
MLKAPGREQPIPKPGPPRTFTVLRAQLPRRPDFARELTMLEFRKGRR